MSSPKNEDRAVVQGFGDEWTRFDQQALRDADRTRMFNDYFHIFPWERISAKESVGADIGCGSGRWALMVAPHVKTLHCIDASAGALEVARRNLSCMENVLFHLGSVDSLPVTDESLDFAFSLGVLHHVPDPISAIRGIAAKMKSGAPLLVYLYYAFESRPFWFRLLWRATDIVRRGTSRLPFSLRYGASQAIAFVVYLPLARTAKLLERYGCMPRHWPLSYYRDKSFYVIRTDALDRFGTRLEHRFTREDIRCIVESAGFKDIRFSDRPPFWCAVAIRR
jgi:SAM-dependent methyltransferase